jgi:uncharacterized protein
MDVTPLIKEGQQIIQSYAGGKFRVSAVEYNTPIIVSPQETIEWKNFDDFDSLNEESFQSLIDRAEEIDVVLLGTGETMKFFDPALKASLSQKGLVIDAMDTGAACRTYNVLMAEGRRVVAVLIQP